LIHHWSLDNTLVDRCSAKNLAGSPIFETGYSSNKVLRFNGTYYLTFPSSIYLHSSFTIFFRFKYNAASGSVFDFSIGSSNADRIQYVASSNKAELLFYTGSGSTSRSSFVTNNFGTGNWFLMTTTFSSGTAKSYIDGAVSKTTSITETVNNVTRASSFLGTDKSHIDIMDFSLSDFRIYNRALSDAEVAALV